MERLLYLFGKYPLDFVSYLSSLLPIFIGLLTYQYHRLIQRCIWLFFIFLSIKDSYSLWYVYHVRSNIHIQNLETLFEIGFVGLIYYSTFTTPVSKRIIALTGLAAAGVVLLTYDYERVSFISLLTYRVYSISLSLAYFNKVMVDLRIKNILKHTLFWFSAGLLIFATGTFFVSLFSEFIFNPQVVDDATFDTYWNLNNTLSLIFASLSATGLWFSRYDRENIL